MTELGWADSPLLLWVDIETTGLDPKSDDILEIGLAVTGRPPGFDLLCGTSVLVNEGRFDPLSSLADRVPEFHRGDDGGLGLLDQAWHDGLGLRDAVCWLQGWLSAVVPQKKGPFGPMCGSSVHFDRLFLERKLPEFVSEFWTYRNFDVSTLRELHAHMLGGDNSAAITGLDVHRASADLLFSIEVARQVCREIVRRPRKKGTKRE